MKSGNIENKLVKLGKRVEYKKFGYWENILHCEGTAIANYTGNHNTIGINTEFKFADVLDCIGKYSDMSRRYDMQGNHTNIDF